MKKHYVISNIVIFCVLGCLTMLTVGLTVPIAAFNQAEYKPIYKGNEESGKVALMINVYWGTEHLDDMLTVLDNYGVKCTFFVGGMWANENTDYLKKIHSKGHEIGNHGYFHKDHDKINREKNIEEIKTCEQVVNTLINVKTYLFAPPSGAFNATTLSVTQELGYKTIMWSKDTIDWRDKNAELVFSRATKKASPGDLILMHPTKHTAEALPRILEYYKSHSLSADTVSNVIA